MDVLHCNVLAAKLVAGNEVHMVSTWDFEHSLRFLHPLLLKQPRAAARICCLVDQVDARLIGGCFKKLPIHFSLGLRSHDNHVLHGSCADHAIPMCTNRNRDVIRTRIVVNVRGRHFLRETTITEVPENRPLLVQTTQSKGNLRPGARFLQTGSHCIQCCIQPLLSAHGLGRFGRRRHAHCLHG